MAEVDVWRIRLDVEAAKVHRAKATLPADERARAERLLMPHLHDRFVVAHAGLRSVLADALGGADPASLAFDVGPHGKPTLRGAVRPRFNLSHSRTEAVVAVCPDRIVGVDIEQVRPDAATEDVAATVFSDVEREALSRSGDPVTTFFRTWVAKEAYIKAHGRGLSMPLSEFDVEVEPGRPTVLAATRPDPREASRWWLRELPVPVGFFGALVVARGRDDATPPVVTERTWTAD